MTINVLFAAHDERWEQYETHLKTAFESEGLSVNLDRELDPEIVDYIVYAPNSSVQDFTPYTRLKGVHNLWAGVETAVGNPTLNVPFARMVDEGLTRGMVEWVTGHVLRHHLGMDAHILGQDGIWRTEVPPLAKDRKVVIFGIGALGRACAETLVHLGFQVYGWSASSKNIPGVTCYNGPDGFVSALEQAEIAVTLLPDTPATTHLFDKEAFGAMPEGAILINPGRGPLIDNDALIEALDAEQLGHATLDAFTVEPLPAEHPFWEHPKVTVTPHIASATRSDTASQVVASNFARMERGEEMLNLVDFDKGY